MDPLVDSHVHLDRYSDEQVATMVRAAEAAGVVELLTVGTTPATSRAARRLAGRYPTVRAAVGIHPLRLASVGGAEAAAGALHALLAEAAPEQPGTGPAGGLAALGEVGLDDGAPDPAGQARFLDAALGMAAERGLPVVLHVVGRPATHAAAIRLLRRYPSVRAVAHYFVGDPDLARRYLDAGCWLSVGRPVTRPAEAAVRAAVAAVPAERLLLETDTYPLPGRTTEPRDVTTVCAAVAELRGEAYGAVAAASTASYRAFIEG